MATGLKVATSHSLNSKSDPKKNVTSPLVEKKTSVTKKASVSKVTSELSDAKGTKSKPTSKVPKSGDGEKLQAQVPSNPVEKSDASKQPSSTKGLVPFSLLTVRMTLTKCVPIPFLEI